MRTLRTLAILVIAGALVSPLGAVTRRMFVTSVTGTGNLSTWADAGGHTGLAAGDAICQARAAAAGLPNAPDYRAWLSSALDDAYCRLHGLTGKMSANCGQPTLPGVAGPWWRTDGEPFGAGLPDLVAPVEKVLNPASVSELGTALSHRSLWTGTDSNGAARPETCTDWTSAVPGVVAENGETILTSTGWTSSGNSDCSSPSGSLLCFETGIGDPLPTFPAWGRLAFLTSAHGTGDLGGWPQAGGATGLAAGDAICRSLASSAGIRHPESFKAWLSDAGTHAIDRFEHDGPWLRLDGIEIAAGKADLTDNSLASSVHLTETGDYLGNWAVWTGTLWTGESAPSHCASWTSGSTGTGEWGRAWTTNYQWTQNGGMPCDFEWSFLYCLQDLPLVFFDGFGTGGTTAWSVVVP